MPKLTSQERAELEAEREFLVRSLDDLEAERAEGGIDDDTYETLHSDYTARTASVLRALAGTGDAATAARRPPVAAARRWTIVAAILVFAGFAAFTLTKMSGTRAQGGLPSGGVTVPTAAPNTYQGHIDAANRFRSEGNPNQATKEYLAAAKLRPRSPEPLTDVADMLLSEIRFGISNDPKLITQANTLIGEALRFDPKYAPAFYERGIAHGLLRQVPQAVADLHTYLRLDPTGALAADARSVIQQLTAPSPTTTTPSATTSTTP